MTSPKHLSSFSTLWRRAGLFVCLTAGLTGCGGAPVTPGLPDPGLTNVVTESRQAREATIGPEGGMLSVTGTNGVVYTLNIPANALFEDTVIGMYPVSDVTTTPGTIPPVAGVHLVPEGLEFLLSATLTMTFPAGSSLADLVAIEYTGDGQNLAIHASVDSGLVLTSVVQHFSGRLAVTGQEVLDGLGLEGAGALPYLNRIHNAPSDEAALAIYVEWYKDLVLPLLKSGFDAPLTDENFDPPRREYDTWRAVISIVGIETEVATRMGDEFLGDHLGRPYAGTYLADRFTYFNNKCLADPGGSVTSPTGPVAMAARALGVRALAEAWGIQLEEFELQEALLLDRLCVKVVVQAGFVSPTTKGGSATIQGSTGITVAGGPVRHDLPMRVKFARRGQPTGSLDNIVADPDGSFTLAVNWPTSVDRLEIDLLAFINRTAFGRISRFERIATSCVEPEILRINTQDGESGEEGIFFATETGSALTYAWNFGGGATPNEVTTPVANVTFGDPGSYEGSLTIGNGCGSDSATFTYTVEPGIPDYMSHSYTGTLEYVENGSAPIFIPDRTISFEIIEGATPADRRVFVISDPPSGSWMNFVGFTSGQIDANEIASYTDTDFTLLEVTDTYTGPPCFDDFQSHEGMGTITGGELILTTTHSEHFSTSFDPCQFQVNEFAFRFVGTQNP